MNPFSKILLKYPCNIQWIVLPLQNIAEFLIQKRTMLFSRQLSKVRQKRSLFICIFSIEKKRILANCFYQRWGKEERREWKGENLLQNFAQLRYRVHLNLKNNFSFIFIFFEPDKQAKLENNLRNLVLDSPS